MNRTCSLAFLLLAAPACSSFAHGIARNEEKILSAWDEVQTRVDSAGGQVAGVGVAPFHAVGKFLLVVVLAGLQGSTHAPETFLEVLGVSKCEDCAADRAERARRLEAPAEAKPTPSVPEPEPTP